MSTQTSQPAISRTIGAFVLIALGGIFFASNFIQLDFGSLWPAFILLPGAAMLAVAWLGNKSNAGFFFPGVIVTGTGLILAYQNMTGNWESWAYVWALYPVMVGLASVLFGERTGNEGSIKAGRGMVFGGIIGFLAFAAFFELFIFGDGMGGAENVFIPLLLIGAGVFLLFGGSRRSLRDETDKMKNELPQIKSKHANPADVNPALRRKIDEALAEDEPKTPTAV
jgi:hypothetical protein